MMQEADWAGAGRQRMKSTFLWVGLILLSWNAHDRFGTPLTIAIILFYVGLLLGSWLGERHATRQQAPVSPYEVLAIAVSPVSRRWFFGTIAAQQLFLCWAWFAVWDWIAQGAKWHVAGVERLLVPVLLQIVIFWAVSVVILHKLRGRPHTWFSELRLDPAGLHVPGFLRRPIAWSEIAQIRLAWRYGMPSVVLRLRQLPHGRLVLRRGMIGQSDDRREIRLALTGWMLSARSVYGLIQQRWQGFGDTNLAPQGEVRPGANHPASGAVVLPR